MLKNKFFSLQDFEIVSEPQGAQLLGGFSKSFSIRIQVEEAAFANNCRGGNCIQGCGGDNNVICNNKVGCGGAQ